MDFLVPEQLETERLILRTFQEPDWQDLYALYCDEEAVRYTVRRALNEDDTWRVMACFVGHWQIRGYGPYAVESKETGKVMGAIGLWYPNAWPEPEIMWSLARPYWGAGYAKEAASAVKEMAHTTLPDIPWISMTDKNNTNSRRLAESLGAKLEKELEFKGYPCVMYRHQF